MDFRYNGLFRQSPEVLEVPWSPLKTQSPEVRWSPSPLKSVISKVGCGDVVEAGFPFVFLFLEEEMYKHEWLVISRPFTLRKRFLEKIICKPSFFREIRKTGNFFQKNLWQTKSVSFQLSLLCICFWRSEFAAGPGSCRRIHHGARFSR